MSILVTRPSPAGDELVTRLRNMGQPAWSMPLIEFTPGRELWRLPQHLNALSPEDIVILLSRQVINYTQPRLIQPDFTWPATLDYYAIGRRTALSFHTASGLAIEFPREGETSEMLLQLPGLQNPVNKRVLILRGNGGRQLLGETLSQRGAEVIFCECYQRCARIYDGAVEAFRWRKRGITTLVVTSGEMLQQLYGLFPEQDRKEWLLSCKLIVVSERLAIQAKTAGWQTIKVADGADNDALLRALQ